MKSTGGVRRSKVDPVMCSGWHARLSIVLVGVAPSAAIAAPAPQPPPPPARIRVAIPQFQIEGDGSTPAMALQLQDGFVLGLVSTGADVVDPLDMVNALKDSPELQGCDSSPCLKAIGQKLGARYLVQVKVETTGNSYKMVARTFSTQGAVPAALPLDTQSKSCDVCTVAEARLVMRRLADAVKRVFEEAPPPAAPPAPLPPAGTRPMIAPLIAAMVGAVAVAGGIALLLTREECDTTMAGGCSDHRTRSAIAGGLIGGGLAAGGVGVYFVVTRARAGRTAAAPTPAVASAVLGVTLHF